MIAVHPELVKKYQRTFQTSEDLEVLYDILDTLGFLDLKEATRETVLLHGAALAILARCGLTPEAVVMKILRGIVTTPPRELPKNEDPALPDSR